MIKGALHIHSDVSGDSQVSRTMLKDLFKKNGYNFLLITEHSEDLDEQSYDKLKKEYEDLSDDNFLMIPGLEIKWNDSAHFLAYGARNYMRNVNNMLLKDTIKAIKEKTQCRFLVWGHFNSPKRYKSNFLSIFNLIHGIEVFNAGYHGTMLPDFSGLKFLNHLKKNAYSTLAVGGLDLHNSAGFNGISCIIEGLDALDEAAIFDLLKRGEFTIKGRYFDLRQGFYGINVLAGAFLVSTLNHYQRALKNKFKELFKLCTLRR